jgi:hypothetical protein
MTEKEVVLTELEEVVGQFGCATTNNLFTELKIGGYRISLENGRESTEKVVEELKAIKQGTKIGILRFNGGFRVRRVER